MNKGIFHRILPHLIAVVVFLVVALIYCRPAIEGKVLNQEDITQWKASMKQSEDYKATHGQVPLWTNALFSGMPTFAIAYPTNNYIPWYAHEVLTLHLPKPIQFFFLACICFYFLCIVLRINPYIGIFGALSFAYATYNPVIISVGHDTKMWSIAYMPALLGSILLIYDKKYWLGTGLTGLFTSIMISMNHPQIAYYLFIALVIMTIFFLVRWIRQKDYNHLMKALSLTLLAAVVGLLTNAVSLLSTYEYQKSTIRGGSALAEHKKDDAKNGLGKDYAFAYSMENSEPFVMMVPKMFGGSSDKAEVDQESSKAIEAASTLPREIQQQLPLTYYWGGIGVTSGPPYVGALICFLAILAMFVLDNKHKWWMFSAIVLTIIMSWGSNLEQVNTLFYKYLPLYNKFRAPSMILVVPQLLLPALAVLGLHKIAFYEEKESLWPSIKKGLIATGIIIAILLLLYMSFDFLSERDKDILKQVNSSGQPQLSDALHTFFNGLKEDRKSLMLGSLFRSLGFMAAGFLFVYLLYKKKINKVIGFAVIALLSLVDLIAIDSKYLNEENYVDAPYEGSVMIPETQADQMLKRDTSFYRVLNEAGDPFSGNNYVSYQYNSVGGYQTARLAIYNDLIDSQLRKGNPMVYNMLNTKYIIQKDQNGATQSARLNPNALGNAWFVKYLHFVPDAHAEMRALDNLNPKDTAVIQQSFKAKLGSIPVSYPGTGSIQLIKNDNEVVTYRSSSSANEFAVFSEIFYDPGWKAFVDKKEVPIVKVDYVLRGIPVAAGNHEIVFRFEPPGFLLGRKITTIFSIIMVLLLVAGVVLQWRSSRQLETK
jgi:hypothetical protein